MQTWGGGIKAAVKSYRLRFQRSTESFFVCGDMNKTAPLEFLKRSWGNDESLRCSPTGAVSDTPIT